MLTNKVQKSRPGSEQWALNSERGFALTIVIFITALFLAITGSSLFFSGMDLKTASNHKLSNQAFYVADAGIEAALVDLVSKNFDSVLVGPDGLKNTKDDGIPSFGSSVVFGGGAYAVKVRDNDDGDGDPFADVDGKIFITSTGSIGGAQQVVEALVSDQYIASHALLGQRGVKVKKNSSINGQRGSVHDNTKTEIKCEGTGICIEKTATSSTDKCKNCTDPKLVGMPETSGGNKPSVKIPKVSPMDFIKNADYILGDKGEILDGKTGAVLAADAKKTPWNGWTMGGRGEWINDSDAPPNGTYYASKRIRITGNPGALGAAWRATLIAGSAKNKGKVEVRGDAVIEPDTPGLLFVAGKVKLKWKKPDNDEEDVDDKDDDAKAKETDDADDKKDDDDDAKDDADDDVKEVERTRPRNYMQLTGTIIATSHKDNDKDKAKGRVKISGDVRLNGNVVADGRIEVKGATVTYNGSGPRLPGTLQIIAWRQVLP